MARIEFGPFVLDEQRCELRKRSRVLPVQRKTFDFLRYLIAHRDRMVSREELLRAVWLDARVTDASINRTATLARKALDDDASRPRWIETVRGRGFRFIGVLDAASAPQVSPAAPGSAGAASDPALAYRRALVGRAAEQALLSDALAEARRGRGGILLIEGEAGIGKSRLLEWCAGQAERHELASLRGSCPEEEGAPPLWPWIQVLRGLVGERGIVTAASVASLFPELGRMFPELVEQPAAPALDATDTPGARFRTFDALSRLLAHAARQRPLALLLDDLHRADLTSILLLEFLAQQLSSAGVVFVGTLRSDEPRSGDALGRLAHDGRCTTLALRGLSEAEVRELFSIATEGHGSQALAREIWQQTGGNPFFVHQVIPLAAAPDFEARVGASSLAEMLPRTVRRAVEQHCDGLSAAARRMIRMAAVIGREFELELLAEGVLARAELVAKLLLEASARGLVSVEVAQPGRYRFTHALVRDVLYAELDEEECAQSHLRVAFALEARPGAPATRAGEIAHHFERGASPDARYRAAHYHVRAGSEAGRRLAYPDGIAHLERALSILDELDPVDERLRCDALSALAQQKRDTGLVTEAAFLWRRAAGTALQLDDSQRFIQVFLALCGGFDFWAQRLGWIELPLLEQAVARREQAPPPERARLLARLSQSFEVRGRTEEAEGTSEEALTLAAATGDPLAQAEALASVHLRLRGTPEVQRRCELAAQIIAHANASGRHGLAAAYRVFYALDLAEMGRFREFDLELAQHAELGRRLQSQEIVAINCKLRGLRAMMRGDFAGARALIEEGLAAARRCDRDGIGAYDFAGQNVGIAYETGAISPEVVTVLESPVSMAGNSMSASLPVLVAGRLWLYQAAERRDLVRLGLERIEQAPLPRVRCEYWLAEAAILAQAVAYGENAALAEQICAWLKGYESAHAIVRGGVAYVGPIARYLGLLSATLGEWRSAHEWLRAALDSVSALEALPWQARIELDLAELFSRRRAAGDRRQAREHARAALARAEQLGMALVAKRARQLLE